MGRVCVICGKPLVRARTKSGRWEKPFRFRERTTCGGACKQELVRRTVIERGSHRKPRGPRLAPEGHEFRGFPTPGGMKSRWATVTGESLPPVAIRRGPRGDRPPILTEALREHPELVDAFSGTLTDAWWAYSRRDEA